MAQRRLVERNTWLSDIEMLCSLSENGCWIWTRSLDGVGYGKVNFEGTLWSVPRLVLTMTTGISGKVACHKECDRRACCNPNHLYWGDHKTNMEDAYNRGRYNVNSPGRVKHVEKIRSGEIPPPASKLTTNQVLLIRERLSMGEKAVDIAEEFGMHPEHIGAIKRRQVWKNV